ncbi:MAG TPA: RHS repeat domain-containing protein, partial [Gammaproteobacteria bacterium]|nr:RHS repeat domain-containing protein [Gammaproteobacteria bacterium]
MRKRIVTISAALLLALFSRYTFSSVPVWIARDPPWPCSYGFSVRQYGSSALDAFDNLFDFKAERCFIGCATTPYPPPFPSCRYIYEFETLLTGSQCTAPGTCFRYRFFDEQNPQNGWQTADTYFRITYDRYNACPDGSIAGTDDNALLECEVPATPWSEAKNLGMACASHTLAGNPVNVATGNKVHSEIDIDSQSSRVSFERFYNSLNAEDVGLGVGWTSTWHRRLEVGAFRLMVRDADGRGERWHDSTANQLWVGEGDSRIRLVESNDKFEITRENDSVETYHFTGRLSGVMSIDGVTTTLAYQDTANPDRLLAVTNSISESIVFTYTPDNHIETITDHAGNVWTYTYDANNNL